MKEPNWSEAGESEIEDRIALVTRAGVWLSGIVIVAGILLEMFTSKTPFAFGSGPFDLHAGPAAARQSLGNILADVARSAVHGNSLAIIQAGIILLIATPWVRVAMSIWLYVRQRDPRYTAVCVVLLVIMTVGLVVGA